jgi:hypothetical protein
LLWNDVIEIGEVRAFLSVWGQVDTFTEKHEIIELYILGPNELGALEIIVVISLLGFNFILGILFGVRPRTVIEIDSEPIFRQGSVLYSRILRIAPERPR